MKERAAIHVEERTDTHLERKEGHPRGGNGGLGHVEKEVLKLKILPISS